MKEKNKTNKQTKNSVRPESRDSWQFKHEVCPAECRSAFVEKAEGLEKSTLCITLNTFFHAYVPSDSNLSTFHTLLYDFESQVITAG